MFSIDFWYCQEKLLMIVMDLIIQTSFVFGWEEVQAPKISAIVSCEISILRWLILPLGSILVVLKVLYLEQ